MMIKACRLVIPLVAALLLFIVMSFSPQHASAFETINTLDFFVSKHTDKVLSGTHPMSQTTNGTTQYFVKWAADSYEVYSWDDAYIYIKEDHSGSPLYNDYTFSNARWMKRSMQVGEQIDNSNNQMQEFDPNSCSAAHSQIFPYKMTLEKHDPHYNLGGDLGYQDVIILKYDYSYGGATTYERSYFSKEWGLVKWEQYNGDTIIFMSIFNTITQADPILPDLTKSCISIPIPQNPIQSAAQCSTDGKSVTVSWSPSIGATMYFPRVNDNTTSNNSWCPAGWSFTQSTCYQDAIPSTSSTITVTPDTAYIWWVHAGNQTGINWNTTSSRTFTCKSPVAPIPPVVIPSTPEAASTITTSSGSFTATPIQNIPVNNTVSTIQKNSNPNAVLLQATSTSSGSSLDVATCVGLSMNLKRGMRDKETRGEVTRLQRFLGISPATGYFGPLTEAKVQVWQGMYGIVSLGSAQSTGYGAVGPRTKKAMACKT